MAAIANNDEQILQQNVRQDTSQAQPVQQQAQQTQQQNVGAGTNVSKAVTAGNVQSSTLTNGSAQVKMPANNYQSPYDQQLKDLYDQIVSRPAFEYNADDDQMYQAYKERYQELGQQAMRDTMGQAAALTGGYGSSYGQAAGQQTYDQYMLGLNDKALEMSNAAYARWADEGNRQLQNYELLGNLADRDYQQWSDAYGRGAAAYALTGEEAAARAQYGDFSGYAALYGDEAAHAMELAWATANPDAAWAAGTITEDEYYELTGSHPHKPNGGVGAGKDPRQGTLPSFYNMWNDPRKPWSTDGENNWIQHPDGNF